MKPLVSTAGAGAPELVAGREVAEALPNRAPWVASCSGDAGLGASSGRSSKGARDWPNTRPVAAAATAVPTPTSYHEPAESVIRFWPSRRAEVFRRGSEEAVTKQLGRRDAGRLRRSWLGRDEQRGGRSGDEAGPTYRGDGLHLR